MGKESGSDEQLAAYRDANRIRRIELEIARRYHLDGHSPMKCPTHLSVGAEHLAVAVARNMPNGTKAYSTHRSHAHYLAWGGDLRRMLAELYGKQTGCASGWGGSMHLVDTSVDFMGTSAIVGSSLSYAVGSALAAKLEGSDRWTVAFVGDAVPETGQFWEAINFAQLKQLRLFIVVEDNDLATATPKSDRQANNILNHGVNPHHVRSGSDYNDIVSEIKSMISSEQSEDIGPQVLVVEVERYFEHVGPNLDDWRDAPVLWGEDDPIVQMRKNLSQNPDHLKDSMYSEVDEAFDQAAQDPWPAPLPQLFYGGRDNATSSSRNAGGEA
jgi:TPP-dependent pyruvate/acetoin dehydrogenase alpha subunit